MKRILILSAILSLSLGATAHAAVVDRIAAVVNNDIITTYALDQAVAVQTARKGEKPLSDPNRDALRHEILNQLVDNDLLEQKSKELGISVSDKEIAGAIKDVETANHLTDSQLKGALEAQGMSLATYRENLRKQILRFKLVGREVRSKVEVTHQELLDYFRTHIDDYRKRAAVQISDITFPLPASASAAQADAVRRKALRARARIEKGEDFTAVLNDCATADAARGGKLGTFTEDQLTPVFARAIKGLKKGEISQVVETPQGFHLLKVTGLTPGKIQKFDTVKDEIRKTLVKQKTQQRFKKWTTELKQKAYIDIRL